MSIVLLLSFCIQKSSSICQNVHRNSALLPCHCSQLVPDATQTVYHGVQCLSTQLHCNCRLTWTAANAWSVLELRQTHTQIIENIIWATKYYINQNEVLNQYLFLFQINNHCKPMFYCYHG